MNRWTVLLAAILACIVLAMGCSKGGNSPVTPNDLTANKAATGTPSQTHLWGFYDVYVDIPTQTATAVLNRNAMFAANVVQFLNGKVANLQFQINGTPAGTGYVDVDIDVKITHPFAGLPQYNGYDVRGIFIGNASKTLAYNSKLKYAAHGLTVGTDQEMHDFGDIAGDPHPGKVGSPDGYTRWFNPVEFTNPGMFGYTPGMFASGGYTATATLNPYKYFADGLSAGGDVWAYLTSKTPLQAVFSSGQTNTRNYYLRFPTPSPGIKYEYAVVANWISATVHPAHAPEAVGLDVTVTPDLFYVSSSDKGGKLILDMSFNRSWGMVPAAIFIESTVLSSPHQMTSGGPEMIPTGGGATWSTYHVEIPADNITGNSNTMNHEFWVIPQYDGYNYKSDFGVPNGAGDDKLAAFFRYDLFVNFESSNHAPIAAFVVVTPMPVTSWFDIPVTFHSISYDPDPGETSTLTYHWDFDGDNVFDEATDDKIDSGTPIDPVHIYTSSLIGNVHLMVTDVKGASGTASQPVSITKKTTCGTMPLPTTFPSSYPFILTGALLDENGAQSYCPPTAMRGGSSVPKRILYPYGAYGFGICTADTYIYQNDFSAGTKGLHRWVVTSTNKIIFEESTHGPQLYSIDYDPTTNAFSNPHSNWGATLPNLTTSYDTYAPIEAYMGQYIWRWTIDENDQPIILILYYANKTGSMDYYLEMFWYNKNTSSWGNPIDLPSEIKTACGDWLAATWGGGSNLNDMDYDPTTGYVLIVTDVTSSEGIFAVDKTGNLKWSDTDIWNVIPGEYKVAIEVPHTNTTSDSECRITAFLTNGAFTSGDRAWIARFNPIGGEKKTGQVSVPYGYGLWGDIMCCLVPPSGSVSTWRLFGHASEFWSGYASPYVCYFDMPSDF